jgi:lysophospholipase L1-like esterase
MKNLARCCPPLIRLLALLGFAIGPGARADDEIRVAIVGDSTVCDFPTDKKMRGWGQILPGFFRGNVKVANLARSGRSTKTFIAEGTWKKTLAGKPAFVLIQFGHNDSHGAGRPESTDASGDFRDFLRRYIDESRDAGATPILITPMHRRRFDADGKVTQELLPYADAMKAVAAEKKTALIDLHSASGTAFEKLGDAGSADLSCCAPDDRTHFSEKGARLMAQLIAERLKAADAKLGAVLK